MCACALLFMYMSRASLCVCTHARTHTRAVCLGFPGVLVTILIWRSRGRRLSGPGQGDRSGQVCVCERTPVCQRFVPGQQVASGRTSVTFFLSLLSLSVSPKVPKFISPDARSLRKQTNLRHVEKTNTHTHTNHRCGWFIHEVV